MADPVLSTALICAGVIAACWLFSVITREYSWTDRAWSLLPPVYACVYAASRDWADARLDLMAALVVCWGARLTFNFARKGGFKRGGEDYRWGVLRQRITGWKWQAFNLAFIAGYQNVLVWLITTPLAVVPQTPLGAVDVALATLFLAALIGETIADQQQWNFHRQKTAPGFLTTGLFAFSRHPNFFFEQVQWWVLAMFPMTVVSLHWLGPALLTALFLGSTRFTESISVSKYPEYRAYQARVSAQVPWPPRKG